MPVPSSHRRQHDSGSPKSVSSRDRAAFRDWHSEQSFEIKKNGEFTSDTDPQDGLGFFRAVLLSLALIAAVLGIWICTQ